MRRIFLLVSLLLVGTASTVPAQGRVRAEIQVDSLRRPSVRLRTLTEDPRWRSLLDDAFRINLEWRVELWRSRFMINANEATFEFRVVVYREPLLGQYVITRYQTNGELMREDRYTDFTRFVYELEQPVINSRVAPRTEGEWYYATSLTISALDDEQFEELQRFTGSRGTSGGNAISGFLLRLVGLPTQTLTAQSRRFNIP